MSTILIVALCAALVGVGLLLLPLRLRFSLQARGEPSGFWALAGGVQLGPLAASGVAAKGLDAQLALHAFGRKLWGKKLAELGAREAEPEEPEAEPEPEPAGLSQMAERYRSLERWLDPTDLLLFVAGERRRIQLEPTVVDLEYGFRDIALTGKLLGAIYALSAMLPAPLIVRQTPSWESLDRASLAGSGSIRFWPGLLVVDAAWYLIRNVKIRRRDSAARGAPEAT